MRIKVGDTVKVIAGDERGETGKVIRVLIKRDKVVVEGVNKVFQARPSQPEEPARGSGCRWKCPCTCRTWPWSTRRVTLRGIGMRATADGGKERYYKKGGASAGLVTPSKNQREANRKKKK
jgi:large subunit ribosomal protein L24